MTPILDSDGIKELSTFLGIPESEDVRYIQICLEKGAMPEVCIGVITGKGFIDSLVKYLKSKEVINGDNESSRKAQGETQGSSE